MAVVSFGYPGTINPGVTWAEAQLGMGSRYWVHNFDSVRVIPKVGGSRDVSIAPGFFGGWGVTDYNSESVTVRLPEVVAGTEWFLIVARRTWGVDAASSETTFVSISAGTSPVIPARNTDRGVLDDQPLALVPLTAGQTLPGTPIDVRALGVGKEDYLILHELALSYLAEPGVRARLGKTVYQYGMNAAGNGHAWIVDPGPYGTVPLPVLSGAGVITASAGWTAASPLINEAIMDGNLVDLRIDLRRTGARIEPNAYGDFGDQQVATILAPFRPDQTFYLQLAYFGGPVESSRAPSTAHLYLYPDGRLILAAGAPNMSIWPQPNSALTSIHGRITFLKSS